MIKNPNQKTPMILSAVYRAATVFNLCDKYDVLMKSSHGKNAGIIIIRKDLREEHMWRLGRGQAVMH